LQPEKITLEVVVTIFLFFALSLGSFALAWYTGALHRKVAVRLPYPLILVSGIASVIFFIAGYFPAQAVLHNLPGYSCIAGQLIVLIIGVKLMAEAIRFNPEEKIVLIDDRQTLIIVSLAKGINYLFIGMGLGFCYVLNFYVFIVLFGLEIMSIVSGLLSGNRFGLHRSIRTLLLISGIAVVAAAIRSIFVQF
jgi:putative Mn2+ efflux pump MntP